MRNLTQRPLRTPVPIPRNRLFEIQHSGGRRTFPDDRLSAAVKDVDSNRCGEVMITMHAVKRFEGEARN